LAKTRVVIMGAAGRDFHNFNVLYRKDRSHEVVAFTATQIPNIDGRRYPGSLAGALYPRGIPIHPESELPRLIDRLDVQEVVFSYSDVSFQYVMKKGSEVVAAGADFKLLGAERTMLKSKVPVIAVVAVRTGCGKSQTSRAVCSHLRRIGLRVVAVRHPMPYGNLAKQKLQRFASLDDLKRHDCTIEEMEEYEPHLIEGGVVYAGVDYEAILRQAETEADVILWDGGNNDTSFFKADLTITVVDPHRAGHESTYYPGETNVRLADVVIVNKVDSASRQDVERVIGGVRSLNSRAKLLEAASAIEVDNPAAIRGRRVLVVEDGPTLTHGEMAFGAGTLAARRFGASSIVDPRPFAVRTIADTFAQYPATGRVLPAMGYGPKQLRDLAETINRAKVDVVIVGTPIDLTRVIRIKHDTVRVRYGMAEASLPGLERVLDDFVRRQQPRRGARTPKRKPAKRKAVARKPRHR
jgi:predicted GTPase